MNDVITSRSLYGQPDRLETIELTPLGPSDPVPDFPLPPEETVTVPINEKDISPLGRAKKGIAYIIEQFKPGYPLHEAALEVMKALQQLERESMAQARLQKRSHHKKVT